MSNSHGRGWLALFFSYQPPEFLFQKTVVLVRNTPGTFGERAPQPTISLGCFAALVLARAAIIARTHSRPRTQFLLRTKLTHVSADFRQQARRTVFFHPRH